MSPHVRPTVEVVLTKELFGATGSAPQLSLSAEGAYLGDYDREGPAREVFPYGEGALLAIEALGLLPASEAAEWRQRFELARTGWSTGPGAGPEQRRLAEEHLDSLASSLAVAPDTESRGALLDRFNAAFALYLHTGLERPEDAPRWGERLERALGRTVEEFELVEVAGLDPAELHEPGGAEPAPLGAALRVVPAEPARHGGLCVTAVALHEHGFELHWHELREGPDDSDYDFEMHRFDTADDLGTEYPAFDSGGASGTGHEEIRAVIGHSICRKPVAENASELRISRGAGHWLIPLG
jgi:hypothetical protein